MHIYNVMVPCFAVTLKRMGGCPTVHEITNKMFHDFKKLLPVMQADQVEDYVNLVITELLTLGYIVAESKTRYKLKDDVLYTSADNEFFDQIIKEHIDHKKNSGNYNEIKEQMSKLSLD